MANYTTNYNLKKPIAAEIYSVDDANGNMDILDAQLKSVSDAVNNASDTADEALTAANSKAPISSAASPYADVYADNVHISGRDDNYVTLECDNIDGILYTDANDIGIGADFLIKDQIENKAPKNHASTATTYGAGTSSNYGHVKLSDSTNSTSGVSGGTAATPAAVKAAYDKASSANAANEFSTTKKEIGTWVLGQSIWRIPVNITDAKTNSYVTLSGASMYFDIDAYLGYFGVGGSDYKVFSVNLVCNDAGDNYCYTPLYMNMKAAHFADAEHPQCAQEINSFGGSIIGYIDVVDMS